MMNRTAQLRQKFEEILDYDVRKNSQIKKGLFRVIVFLHFQSVFFPSW